MAIKKKQDVLKECETQRDSLYASFGRLLYENIQSGGITYTFDPGAPALTAQAKRLVRDVVVGKITERKPKLDPFVIARRKALKDKDVALAIAKELKGRPIVQSVRTVKPAKPPKARNTMAAVLKGVQNVIKSAMPSLQTVSGEVPPPKPPVMARDPRNLGVERRGQIEPYTRLLIELHVALRKLREIRNDFNDGITVGLLYATGNRTAVCQAAVDEKLQAVISLIEKKQEAIRRVMEQKKQFFAEDTENKVWKPEAEFLKELELDAAETSRRVDGLISEIVDLFKNIKSVYEKEVEAGLPRPPLVVPPPEAVEAQMPEAVVADDAVDAEAQEDDGSDDANGGDQFEVPETAVELVRESEIAALAEGAVEEVPQDADAADKSDGQGVDEDAVDKMDYGLFETGARKLLSEAVDQNEKLAILHTLFRNAPRRVVPYLFELIRDAEMFMRRQLVHLLGQLDYPTMVDLYRRFITDDSSSLRLAGMMGLVKLDSDEAKHVIVSAVNDRDANVRRFIVNHLDHGGNEPDATALARLARDVDETVARIALRKIGLMSNHFAFVTAVPLLESANIKIRKEAIAALVLMTGTDLGFDCGAPEVERARAVRQWKILSKESYAHPRFLRDMRSKYAPAAKAAVVPVVPVKVANNPKAAGSVKPAAASVKPKVLKVAPPAPVVNVSRFSRAAQTPSDRVVKGKGKKI